MARLGLLVAAVAVIMLVLPRADHQSYSFELNQPWKYPLLTAEFDTPVLRDTTSAREMRDSINANFIPFVKRSEAVEELNVARLENALHDSVPEYEAAALAKLLRLAYQKGIMGPGLSASLKNLKTPKVRATNPQDASLIQVRDASDILTPGEAFDFIDSSFNSLKNLEQGALSSFEAHALYSAIAPNITIDTLTDEKFRSQELLEVTAALGVIKQGQRIVDRGEIVTNQIYTNLTTYMKMLEEKEDVSMDQTYYTIGRLTIILLVMIALFLFLRQYAPEFYGSVGKMTFLMCYITLFVVFAILMFEYVPNGLYLVPFAAVPVVIMIFSDARIANISLLATVLISSLVATFPQQFIILEMLAGILATLSITQLTRRSQLLQTALITFVVYAVGFTGMELVREGSLDYINYWIYGYYAVNAVLLSFAYVLILVFEKVFGFTSNVTLVELSDINNKLLRRLAEEAPGTFQHSVQVSTLASEAARAINANSLLTRTGALYHDIGKLESPFFFTENQHGQNPHEGLEPETSARKIISHVSAGISLAKESKLPKVIREFITQHHGQGVARYFYNTAVNARGEENVNKADFEYPGPNPTTKETAILMMADAVEAASRSLKDYSPQSITNLVNKIIDGQLAEGLFKNSPISFQDIEKIKKTFVNRLGTIYHSRIAYPELNKK